MKICSIGLLFTDILHPYLSGLGHEVVTVCDGECDVIIGWSISQIDRILAVTTQFPNIPAVQYNWDLYEWIKIKPGGYKWKEYGDLLNSSLEVWTPSYEVNLRTEEFYGCGDKCYILKCFARLFDYHDVIDARYVYQPVRHYTLDRNFGWLRQACAELDIPLVETLNSVSEEDFQRTIAHCSFLCCEYYEASTGGLTLLEGYNLGKPVLISNSPYMGAQDYFGDRATYFQYDDYENFKFVLGDMWNNTLRLPIKHCQSFCEKYTIENMAKRIDSRLKEIL